MAIIKKLIKGVSTVVGEILVVGGALGTAYVAGFLKGSKISDHVEEAADYIKKEVNARTQDQPVESTGEVQEEPTEEVESETPPITVVNNQQED